LPLPAGFTLMGITLFFIGTTNSSTRKPLALTDLSPSGAKLAVRVKGGANSKSSGSPKQKNFAHFP
jgi:hypothetical protein